MCARVSLKWGCECFAANCFQRLPYNVNLFRMSWCSFTKVLDGEQLKQSLEFLDKAVSNSFSLNWPFVATSYKIENTPMPSTWKGG